MGSHDDPPPLTQVELLTEQFYDWERRGRGWDVWPHPVDLEPPFLPFEAHYVALPESAFDDARRPTIASTVTDGLRRLLLGPRSRRLPEIPDEPEIPVPAELREQEPIVELRISLPPKVRVATDAVSRWPAPRILDSEAPGFCGQESTVSMSQYISPEQRAKILSAVKDEGMSIVDAAKTFSVAEKTLRKWLRKQSHNAHTSSTEVQRLKQEVEELRSIIGKMIWQQETKRKSAHRSP